MNNIGVQWKFVESVWKAVVKNLSPAAQRQSKCINFLQPKELQKAFPVEITDKPREDTKDELLKKCEQLIHFSVKTGHPFFLNQLYGGTDPYGLAASLLVESLNTNAFTFDVAPVLSLIELEIIGKICNLIGFSNGEGTFCPGGSIASMYGISLARFNFDQSIKQNGLFGQPALKIFTSAQSHYSVLKGASFMGIGTNNIISIPCDANGSMQVDALEKAIQKELEQPNSKPLMVWCTSGTTVLSAFDPLLNISQVCAKYKIWMHVDACLGGCVLVSEKHRHLLNGIEQADSVAWDWHKMLGAPIQTAVFVTKHKNLLRQSHGACASYLFQAQKHYDTSYDSGDSSIQCSRRPDALKVWLMWQARGLDGLASLVDHAFDMAKILHRKLSESTSFKMVLPNPQGSTVCFWILPPKLQNVNFNDANYLQKLDKVALAIKSEMVKRGNIMVNYQTLPDQNLVNFFRVTITCHPNLDENDINDLVNELKTLSELVDVD